MNCGVYIQVPFCGTKCTYCNFPTSIVPAALYEPYISAVCREIEMWTVAGRDSSISGSISVDTVYIGGGTPSLLHPSLLGRLLDALRANFDCQFLEVTLEADPETLSADNSRAWRALGFSRISLGAQSFSDRELAATGRLHHASDIPRAVALIRGAGIPQVSLDLIAGLPHQTEESWERSLADLLLLTPEHVSIYLLETDEESRLGREFLHGGSRYSATEIPSDDRMAFFYELACARLKDACYDHYEISNWARGSAQANHFPEFSTKTFRSRHNLKYWRREPYLGFGAGAHSFDGANRWANCVSPQEYMERTANGFPAASATEAVTERQALEEELFLGLRQLHGIDFRRIEQRYDVELRSRMEVLADEGLIEIEGSVARLAPSKLTISNEVFVELLDCGRPNSSRAV